MRVFLCAVFFMLFAGRSSGQYPFFGDSRKPTGKISSFTESCYETSSGQQVLVQKSTFYYNAAGQLMQQEVYNTADSNKVDYTVEYSYEGTLLTEEVAAGIFKAKCIYDEKGNRLAYKYSSDTLTYLDRFEYDDKNRMESRLRYDEEGELKFKETFAYTSYNHVMRMDHLDAESRFKNISTVYTTNASGYVLEERCYALRNGHLLYSKSYGYDMNMNLKEDFRYTENGNSDGRKYYEFRYDKANNWVAVKCRFTTGSFVTWRKIEYAKLLPIK